MKLTKVVFSLHLESQLHNYEKTDSAFAAFNDLISELMVKQRKTKEVLEAKINKSGPNYVWL